MKYAYTIIYVKDVQQTLEFYQKAFGFEQKFITPENDYGELISGETTIAFASIGLGNANLKRGFTGSNSEEKPFGV
ncbi:MAG: VOC family protein, partial [Bacteroidota bacterium]